jgi:hypothetical protein
MIESRALRGEAREGEYFRQGRLSGTPDPGQQGMTMVLDTCIGTRRHRSGNWGWEAEPGNTGAWKWESRRRIIILDWDSAFLAPGSVFITFCGLCAVRCAFGFRATVSPARDAGCGRPKEVTRYSTGAATGTAIPRTAKVGRRLTLPGPETMANFLSSALRAEVLASGSPGTWVLHWEDKDGEQSREESIPIDRSHSG